MDFKNSETRENLMRAFAGESQARNRYTFAAATARKEKLPVLESLFLFTAEQERAHAQIFYEHLEKLSGESIHIDDTYPVEIYDDVEKLLRHAQHNEYEEFDPIYKAFGDKAREEGFERIAYSFYSISNIEKIHGDRFGMFADWMEQKQLFQSEEETSWMCLNCGHVYFGKEAPKHCPVCQEEQGYFLRLPFVPYTNTIC